MGLRPHNCSTTMRRNIIEKYNRIYTKCLGKRLMTMLFDRVIPMKAMGAPFFFRWKSINCKSSTWPNKTYSFYITLAYLPSRSQKFLRIHLCQIFIGVNSTPQKEPGQSSELSTLKPIQLHFACSDRIIKSSGIKPETSRYPFSK